MAKAQLPAKTQSLAKTQSPKAPLVEQTKPKAPAAKSESKAAAQAPEPVTITGCLARDDETFRLKETEGADAPRSRSWKSGFLKKRSVSIEVVDKANRLQLPNHVGQRVSVIGVLVGRQMQARSLQRVEGSCD